MANLNCKIGMHRNGLGTKLLISLVDTRHGDNSSQASIALMEVDMNKNLELVFITPSFL